MNESTGSIAPLVEAIATYFDNIVIFPGSDKDHANRDCLAKAKPDEPKFVILGRDPDGGTTVRTWADRRMAAGGDPDHIDEVLSIADRMDAWREAGNRPESAPESDAYPPAPKTGLSFHDLAMRTAAGPENWFPENAPENEAFAHDLLNFILVARQLDRWKSLLIYGKPKDEAKFDALPIIDEEHTQFATVNQYLSKEPEFVHAVLGMASEAGEMVEHLLNKSIGNDVPKDAIIEELGDARWFEELLARAIGVPVVEMEDKVISKLKKRYPGKYSQDNAVARLDKA